ncbi:type II toxin-antitoxin system HicB family antitoxin [Paenibacillus lupini]|uniref:type II toxin-antitoxin system HicB family antitoxin n=1 Tax=Paenibacillus lupini TaxID=1450204 RepID=UPI0014218A8E|nr:type II toxin-antitoxin system HicB family antitoxin [Paenibacillus lupini]NIK24016.1 putative RNase H-like HicB family nuclease [Paenibacillus lupini]
MILYPIILTYEENDGYLVYVPGMEINTHGATINEAAEMAVDAITHCGLAYKDLGKEIPTPATDPKPADGEMLVWVQIDFERYV